MFPEGVTEELHNAFPREFPGLVHSKEHEVEEYEFLGCCHCGRIGIPRSRCDNCRNLFIHPMGRCVAFLVVGKVGTLYYGCDGILVGDKPSILNDKHDSSVTKKIDCVESYDSHVTYPSSNDIKSPLVDGVYFDCISCLSNLDNLQLASSRKLKEVLALFSTCARTKLREILAPYSTCARTKLCDPNF